MWTVRDLELEPIIRPGTNVIYVHEDRRVQGIIIYSLGLRRSRNYYATKRPYGTGDTGTHLHSIDQHSPVFKVGRHIDGRRLYLVSTVDVTILTEQMSAANPVSPSRFIARERRRCSTESLRNVSPNIVRDGPSPWGR